MHSAGIADVLAIEERPHEVRHLLGAPDIAADVRPEILGVDRRPASHRVALDVLAQQLVGVQLRGVAGEEEESETAAIPGEPGLNVLSL